MRGHQEQPPVTSPMPRVSPWRRRLPIIDVVRSYRRQDFPHDLVAGLTLGVVTIPQAIAYAFLAGLPAQAGLYACLAPMVIYALLGSSRQLVVGPVAIAALMVAATVGEHAPAYSDQYLGITTVLSLQVGVFLWLLRLLQVGGFVNLLSHPVITGFINAAALLIIVSQLGAFTGYAAPEEVVVAQLGTAILTAVKEVEVVALVFVLVVFWFSLDWILPELFNFVALAIGVASLALLWLLRRYGAAFVPKATLGPSLSRAGSMLVALIATVAVAVFGLDVATVGYVPAGLPSLTIPAFDAGLWWALAPNAALIALVAYVESYSVGKTLATRQQRRIDGNQELVALGAANIGAALSGAYPVAGSFTRSGVNQAAGGRTPISVLVCALVVVVALLWLTPWFADLPQAALAAIVIASVWGLVDFRSLARHWRFYRPDVIIHVATLVAVLAFGVETGILLGVCASIALFIRGSSRPHIAVIGRLGDRPHFRNVERFSVRTWPQLVAVRVDESLYFANANQIEGRLLALAERAGVSHLLIVMTAVNFIDTSGLAMLQRLTADLGRTAVAVHLCEVKGPVRDQLEHVALEEWLTGRVFQTTDDAFNALT